MMFYLLSGLDDKKWWQRLVDLERAIERGQIQEAHGAYRDVFRCLVERGCCDLTQIAAEDLLGCNSDGGRDLGSGALLTDSLNCALSLDIECLISAINRDWDELLAAITDRPIPSLQGVGSGTMSPEGGQLSACIKEADSIGVIRLLESIYRKIGLGRFAQHHAFVWQQDFIALPRVETDDSNILFDVDDQLDRLVSNTEALLTGSFSQDVLLYGPRGTGKSTAIRGLLKQFAGQGLRMVEVRREHLNDLTSILSQLAHHPQRFVVFLDDLSFEKGEVGYRNLKSLIEGGLERRPINVRFYATSNRRHLIRENFTDRPDPLDDDVNRWDSHNENLSLADRFGLTITFPNQTQHSYVRIVEQLAAQEGVLEPHLTKKAIRYADWGNGYSGRTARQFIDSLKIHLND